MIYRILVVLKDLGFKSYNNKGSTRLHYLMEPKQKVLSEMFFLTELLLSKRMEF